MFSALVDYTAQPDLVTLNQLLYLVIEFIHI